MNTRRMGFPGVPDMVFATLALALCGNSLLACVADKPLENGACPCAPGWNCDTSTQTCVVEGPDGGGVGGSDGIGGAPGAPGAPGAVGGSDGTTGILVDAGPPASACPALIPNGTPPGQAVPGCPCTRRPGPGNSYTCPVGANAFSQRTIGAAGGTVALKGSQGARGVDFTLTIPPGALSQPTVITVTETNLSPPSGFVDFSPVYHVEPDDLALAQIAALQVPSGNNLTMTPQDLALYQSAAADTCAFSRISDSYINAGYEEASLSRGGYLFVAAPKPATQAGCP